MDPKEWLLIKVSDPGHGWLQVPKSLALEIYPGKTDYSYETTEAYWLEEDCEAPSFLNAAKNAGYEIKVSKKYDEYFQEKLESRSI